VLLERLGDRRKPFQTRTFEQPHTIHVGRLAYREPIRMEVCVGAISGPQLMHDLPKGGLFERT